MSKDLNITMKKSAELSEKTLENIKKYNLRPDPCNYSLWYSYFEGNPEVTKALDTLKDSINQSVCEKVYSRYLDKTVDEETYNVNVENVTDQIQEAFVDVGALISGVKDDTTEYGTSLANISESVAKADNMEDLAGVVASMVRDTQKMMDKSAKLEAELDKSSKQVSDLKQTLDVVKKENMTDALTGIANRKAFDSFLAKKLELALEEETNLTLLMIDIDYFKKFNDTHGHQVGDQVLKLVAKTLYNCVKGSDLAARYGGEEFTVVLPDTDIEGAMSVAEALRNAVENKKLLNNTTRESLGNVTISIGVSSIEKDDLPNTILERADTALYTSKENGRNQVTVAS